MIVFVMRLKLLTVVESLEKMFGLDLVVVGSVGFFKMVTFGRKLVLMFLLFMVKCLLMLIVLLKVVLIMIRSPVLFRFSPPESDRFYIQRTHLPQPCISIIAILKLMPLKVTAAGDLCAICQEKMHSPILLRCKHIFCEDCVSEW